jgi:hypothetical protein
LCTLASLTTDAWHMLDDIRATMCLEGKNDAVFSAR